MVRFLALPVLCTYVRHAENALEHIGGLEYRPKQQQQWSMKLVIYGNQGRIYMLEALC